MKYKQIKDCFTAFIKKRFIPDYDEINAENKKLKQDIYNLVRKENDIEGMTTKIRWKFSFDMKDLLLKGNKTI